MSDVGFSLAAKSDQLNAIDIMGVEPVIKIREVKVVANTDQPVSIYFDGDNNRPWKPSKGMLRILAGAWGRESSLWVGRQAQIYFEPSVTYGGKAVGGVRIRALSNIDPKGLQFSLTISRTKREPYPVPLLVIEAKAYPEEQFDALLPKMVAKMQGGKTLQQIIATCQKTGPLSEGQLKKLELSAPVIIDNDDDDQQDNPEKGAETRQEAAVSTLNKDLEKPSHKKKAECDKSERPEVT